MGHPPSRFVRGSGDGTRFWFPLRLRSEPALSVVEGVNSGEAHGGMNDRGTRVHDKNMQKVHVETV